MNDKSQVKCFLCDDGSTTLYCLNCAGDLLDKHLAALQSQLTQEKLRFTCCDVALSHAQNKIEALESHVAQAQERNEALVIAGTNSFTEMAKAQEDARLLRVQVDVGDAAFQQCHNQLTQNRTENALAAGCLEANENLLKQLTAAHKELDELSAQAAVMREALLKWKTYWQTNSNGPTVDPGQKGEDFTDVWFQMEQALSTSAGTALLARLKEAEWLLGQPLLAKMNDQSLLLEWHGRRDEFRNGMKEGDVK